MSNETPIRKYRLPGGFKRKFLVLSVALAVVLGGALAAQSLAGTTTYSHMKLAAFGHGGWFPGGGKRFSEMTEAEIDDRIGRMVRHVAIEIDATDEQSARITTLFTAVARDLKASRGPWLDAREALRGALLDEKVDREQLEQLRTERIAEVDRISRNVVTALADAAEVLTPEQRRVLEQRIEDFHAMRARWHR